MDNKKSDETMRINPNENVNDKYQIFILEGYKRYNTLSIPERQLFNELKDVIQSGRVTRKWSSINIDSYIDAFMEDWSKKDQEIGNAKTMKL